MEGERESIELNGARSTMHQLESSESYFVLVAAIGFPRHRRKCTFQPKRTHNSTALGGLVSFGAPGAPSVRQRANFSNFPNSSLVRLRNEFLRAPLDSLTFGLRLDSARAWTQQRRLRATVRFVCVLLLVPQRCPPPLYAGSQAGPRQLRAPSLPIGSMTL